MPKGRKLFLIVILVVTVISIAYILLPINQVKKSQTAVRLLTRAKNIVETTADIEALRDFYALQDLLFHRTEELIDYRLAVELYNLGEYQAANNLFSFIDSSVFGEAKSEKSRTYRIKCEEYIYEEALVLMESGEYQQAFDIFITVPYFQDAGEKIVECETIIENTQEYAQAQTDFEEGKYYSAYRHFINLGDFSDAADKAKECIQPTPYSEELYRDPDYSGKAGSIEIRTDKDDNRSAFIRIYEENVLVSSIFILSGAEYTIELPEGRYKFELAQGYTWFGLEEMYGWVGAEEGSSYTSVTLLDGIAPTGYMVMENGDKYKLFVE